MDERGAKWNYAPFMLAGGAFYRGFPEKNAPAPRDGVGALNPSGRIYFAKL